MSDQHADILQAAADDERSPERVLADQQAINDVAAWDPDSFYPDEHGSDEPQSAVVRVDDS